MKITKAVATIEPGADDADSPNGTFHVVLSTPSKDRDGEEVKSEEWETPLPEHITFDMDHGMSVATTVGSGKPTVEADGKMHVRGTYSSRPIAQEVRGLVNEKHIRTTSVAFLRKAVRDAKGVVVGTKRELLNGAFVAIPSNTEAVVLDSKSAAVELADAEVEPLELATRELHQATQLEGRFADLKDAIAGLRIKGTLGLGTAAAKRLRSVDGSYEQRQSAIGDALDSQYRLDPSDAAGYCYAYPHATFDDRVVYHVSGTTEDNGDWQATYTVNDDGTVTLGTPERVVISEQVTPVAGGAVDTNSTTGTGKSAAADSSAADASASAADETAAADETESTSEEIQLRAQRIRALALSSL